MNRLTIALGAVIAITAMLAIPNAPAHFARASSCSSQRIQDIPPNKLVERDLGVVQPLAQLQALRLDSALTRTRLVVPPGGNTNSCSSNSIGATTTSFQDKSASGSERFM